MYLPQVLQQRLEYQGLQHHQNESHRLHFVIMTQKLGYHKQQYDISSCKSHKNEESICKIHNTDNTRYHTQIPKLLFSHQASN